ncbi:DUF1796 family putative cysteine peptidase [Bacillus sp. JJ1503]|uniref:DUF1796 family putative cysteine peptidase n=1 Tax=unclassified Bacillus (in: firmicutes) TaxID=185979 RepID=UPI002FFDAF43
MKLKEIKKNYSMIYSLGLNCAPSNHLRYRGLRPFAGVLDWMISPSLADVNRLLANRFVNFMELENLTFSSYYDNDSKLLIKDNYYNIYSAHDFKTDKNTPDSLSCYPEVKEKYKRRIGRFLREMETSESILFIRLGGSYDEAVELQRVLDSLVKHNYCVLLISDSDSSTMIEENWGLDHICVLNCHISKIMWDNYELWSSLLSGIGISRPQ